ncbi:MAG: M28 family metallopeptidase, partial [Candidatus Krumholzibacteria bacterium]|nr:M28 family metallopeptidase [Candidatus Krumholzibacteria bacterium]
MKTISNLLLIPLLLSFLAPGPGCAGNRGADHVNVAVAQTGYEPAATLGLPDDAEANIVRIGKSDNHVMEHLYHLTNRIGPRLAGSENHRLACEWARDRFAKFGLENAHLEECGQVSLGFERGRSVGYVESPIRKELHFSTPEWSPGTKGRIRARAVLAPETAEGLEETRIKLEGAWVLWRPPVESEKMITYIEKWQEIKPEVAGVIRPSSGELIHTMGGPPAEIEDIPKSPNITLLESEWEQISNMILGGEEVSLEFDIENYVKDGPVPIHNVVADIPGTEIPDEYVIIGAHIDSHDGGTGAMDNGTGVAAAMEAARILVESGARPKRTIRFVLFAGEEIGMYGSRGYVRDHPELIPRISAVYNMDLGADHISGILATEAILDDFEVVFAPVKSIDQTMPFAIEPVEYLPRALDCSAAAGSSPSMLANPCSGAALQSQVVKRLLTDTTSTECGGAPSAQRVSKNGKMKIVTMGSSDHAAFLMAGIPAFSWQQKGRNPVPYYLHSQKDT